MNSNWLKPAIKEASKPMEVGERIFGVLIVVVSLLVIAILFSHVSNNTDFIQRELNIAELVLLFGYWIAWIITASLDSIFNKRLESRLFDTFGGILFMAISTIYFLVIFPFDFTIFPTALPEHLQFTVSWITNYVAIFMMGISGLGLLFASVYSPIAYRIVRISK